MSGVKSPRATLQEQRWRKRKKNEDECCFDGTEIRLQKMRSFDQTTLADATETFVTWKPSLIARVTRRSSCKSCKNRRSLSDSSLMTFITYYSIRESCLGKNQIRVWSFLWRKILMDQHCRNEHIEESDRMELITKCWVRAARCIAQSKGPDKESNQMT